MASTAMRPSESKSLAVTNATGNVALAGTGGGSDVVIWNSGSVAVFIKFGNATVAAAITDHPIAPGAIYTYRRDHDQTHVAGITASGTATAYFTCGEGE